MRTPRHGSARLPWRAIALAGALLAAALMLAASLPAPTGALRLPGAPACPVFPRDNPWNQRVDSLPVLGNSRQMINAIGARDGLHPDFGSGTWDGGPIGIPFTTVPGTQPRVPIVYDAYGDESDRGPFPIPRGAPREHGSDHHVIVVDRSRCRLYELFNARRERGGARWRADSGATWNLRSNRVRPAGWTSADAAGLPILPGLVRYDEIARGRIDHALRFTVEESRRAFIHPARHFASDSRDPNRPAMGQRLRLRRSFATSGFPRQARIVLEALKRHGMIVADNGSDWFISGAPDRRWDNDALRTLGRVRGSDFEVVDTRRLPARADGPRRQLACDRTIQMWPSGSANAPV